MKQIFHLDLIHLLCVSKQFQGDVIFHMLHTDLEGLKNVQKLKTYANYKTILKHFINLADECGPKFHFFHLNMTI